LVLRVRLVNGVRAFAQTSGLRIPDVGAIKECGKVYIDVLLRERSS
jgi:hypothetical protein